LLGERLPRRQWAAIGVAFVGVAWLVVSTGSVPWVSLALAASFGFYGLIRKTAAIESLDGLTVELMWLLVPASAYLTFRLSAGEPAAIPNQPWLLLALAATGLVTAGPLLLFASSARKIPLATLGLLQFITPTMQFVLGVWAYGEDFDSGRLVGYLLIWAALIGFTYDVVFRSAGRSSSGLRPARASQTQSRQ
jgi:chloramphenicol-sensitive protein RarD